MNEFSNLTLSPVLQGNLAKNDFVTPTPVQAQAIPPALAGKDVVATAQTGTGKTLAFAIPMIERMMQSLDKPGTGKIRAVVLSPTRELAIQINETVLKLIAGTQIRSAVVVGGMDETRQLRQIRNGAQIVIATPGRLCDFLQRRLVDLRGVQTMVLDEADRMLDMGFLPSIKQILQDLPETRQTLLFSATIEKSVAHLVASYVKNPARISIGVSTKPAEHVDLHVYEIDQDRKLELLTRLLRDEPGAFLVFARTKHGADRLAKHLGRFGHDAARIHGDRTQGQRNQALQGFKDGTYRILVATDVAARGIHVDNIAHVVNFDLPQVPEDFIHRAGRTGRAGSRGVASTFHTRQERGDIRQIERALQVQMNRREVPAGTAPVAKYNHVDDVPVVEKKVVVLSTKSTAKPYERDKPRFKASGGFQKKTNGGSFSPRNESSDRPARAVKPSASGFRPASEPHKPAVEPVVAKGSGGGFIKKSNDGFRSANGPSAGFKGAGFKGAGFKPRESAIDGFRPRTASRDGFKPASGGLKPRERATDGFRPANGNSVGFASTGVKGSGFKPASSGFKGFKGTSFQPAVGGSGFVKQDAKTSSTGFKFRGIGKSNGGSAKFSSSNRRKVAGR